MSRKYLYVDSQVFMHYPSLEADWKAISSSDETVLVISATVFRELDYFKDNGASNVKNRLRKLFTKIEGALGNQKEATVGPGLVLIIEHRKPKGKYEEFDLDDDEPDHQTLLSAILRREAGADVAIVSNDMPLRMTARGHGFEVHDPPDPRFTDPESDLEKRVRKLESEVGKAPDLSLRPRDGSDKATVGIPSARTTRDDETNALWEREIKGRPSIYIDPQGLASSINGRLIGPRTTLAFRKDWDTHLRAFREWAIELFDLRESTERMAKVLLNLVNIGSAPATGLLVEFELPTDLIAYSDDDLPDEPERPERPRIPNDLPCVVPPFYPRNEDYQPALQPFFRISEDRRRLSIEVHQVNHGRPVKLPRFFVKLPNPDAERTFEIQAKIHAENIAQAREVRIPIHCQPVPPALDAPSLLQKELDMYDVKYDD